jgi:hypothetical protein
LRVLPKEPDERFHFGEQGRNSVVPQDRGTWQFVRRSRTVLAWDLRDEVCVTLHKPADCGFLVCVVAKCDLHVLRADPQLAGSLTSISPKVVARELILHLRLLIAA